MWSRWIPEWAFSLVPIGEINMVYMTGAFEAIVGLLIIIGLMTRTAALVAGLMLMVIMPIVGYNDIMIRDVGLLFMAISIMMLGPGEKSMDSRSVRRRKIKEAEKLYR